MRPTTVAAIHAVNEAPDRRTVTAQEAGVVRTRVVRMYPEGNIPEQVARCETLAELRKLVKALGRLVAAGHVSTRATRVAQRAVDARRAELMMRRVVVPGLGGRRTKGGLYLP